LDQQNEIVLQNSYVCGEIDRHDVLPFHSGRVLVNCWHYNGCQESGVRSRSLFAVGGRGRPGRGRRTGRLRGCRVAKPAPVFFALCSHGGCWMEEQLSVAIGLRQEGRVEESRELLLKLVAAHPVDPVVNYQCAWSHDALGLEREAVPFYERAIAGGLAGEELAG